MVIGQSHYRNIGLHRGLSVTVGVFIVLNMCKWLDKYLK